LISPCTTLSALVALSITWLLLWCDLSSCGNRLPNGVLKLSNKWNEYILLLYSISV
jgi:hypothetical protein